MKRLVISSSVAAASALVLALGAVPLAAQQGPPVPPRATAFATAPDIPFESVPNFLKLPPNLYLGEGIGVARKPQPIPSAMINRWQMTAPVHLNPVVQTLHRSESVAAPVRAPETASPAPSESFIAASLRELANPEPLVRSVPEPRRPQAEALLQPEPEPGHLERYLNHPASTNAVRKVHLSGDVPEAGV